MKYDPPQKDEASSSSSNQAGSGGILQSRKGLLVLLFGVTGVLGVPLLWVSPSFSKSEKVLYSLLVTVYTLVLVAVACGILWWAYLRITGA
jgi:hypothetical protein